MIIKNLLSEKQKRSLYTVMDKLPDKLVVHLQYFASLGRPLNLKNPQRFTEKLQWYKLNYRNSLMTICADKYRVREFIESKGYSDYLPELYAVVDKFSEIDLNSLPNSFAIKCNNGSGTNVFIEDKSKADFKEIKKIVDSWEMVNTLSIGREWVYKDIEQKIIVEELLVPEDIHQKENGLNDYKILCFDGEPELAWVDTNRNNDHKRDFYDLNWNKLDVISDKPTSEFILKKPSDFEKMLEISKEFSKEFPFVRVDFYSLNNRIYIGELTFYPWSGCVQFTPDEFDFKLGKLLKLPIKD